MSTEVLLTREGSVAETVERLLQEATACIDAALYRFNSPRLARALEAAVCRGVCVRLVLDRNKYQESRASRELLSNSQIRFRLMYGRQGPGTKMHHKFAILDDRLVMAGSYNWTVESEEQNFESLLILHGPEQLSIYRREFEILWLEATAAAAF